MNSVCVVCGVEFSQHASFQRQTCSDVCRFALIAEKNRKRPPKVVKPPRPPKPLRIKEKKLPHEPRTKSERSSFTSDELNLCRIIMTSLCELPRCRCEDPEKKVKIEAIGNEFKATCEWCGFEAVTVGGKWIGVETVKVENKRRKM